MTAHLEVRDLVVAYAGLRALDGVDLVVPEGAVVALLGPNGSGKSTLLRAISGLIAPESGEILLRGERIDGKPAYAIARLGVCHVPEGRGVFPTLSVRENLALASRGASPIFDELVGRDDQAAGTLSGGQQQMLSLSRAVATGSPLLLLDEVSLGLAPLIVDRLYEEIAAFKGRGHSVLLVEQYVARALALADLVYVLARGSVVFAGEPGELPHAGSLVESYLGAGP